MSEADFTVYTDGGGATDTTAASAAIVCDSKGNEIGKFVGFLGGGTNNEAEITAGLIAFSFLRTLDDVNNISVHWVCDSEYVLKSATAYIFNWQRNGWKTAARKPVKNIGLWKTYLELSRGLKITPEHVRGHTGHEENEKCDSAATWLRENGEAFDYSTAELIRVTGKYGSSGWRALDLRSFIQSQRQEPESLEIEDSFQIYRQIQGDLQIATSGNAQSNKQIVKEGVEDNNKEEIPDIGTLIQDLESAKSKAEKLSTENVFLLEVMQEISALIKKIKNLN